MKYDAVIFDLYGTLIDNISDEAFQQAERQMAALLHAPEADFARLWSYDTWPMRATGAFATEEAGIEYICRALQLTVGDEQVRAAAQVRLELTRRALVPRPDVVETLGWLKSAGYKIGLISDCSLEVPYFWSETPPAALIDEAIFSCSVGLKKPDPRIYALACERLAVTPQKCLYVGDGASQELTGALTVGMSPVMLRTPYEDFSNTDRFDELAWSGPRIAAVREIRAYVDEGLVEEQIYSRE